MNRRVMTTFAGKYDSDATLRRRTYTTSAHTAAGQSTVEFVLVLPILLAVFFFCIEMSLYFTTIHYGNYATFVSARSQQIGFSAKYRDLQSVADLVLTGGIWTGVMVTPIYSFKGQKIDSTSGASLLLPGFGSRLSLPFVNALMPSWDLELKVSLGPAELAYEGVERRSFDLYDNNFY